MEKVETFGIFKISWIKHKLGYQGYQAIPYLQSSIALKTLCWERTKNLPCGWGNIFVPFPKLGDHNSFTSYSYLYFIMLQCRFIRLRKQKEIQIFTKWSYEGLADWTKLFGENNWNHKNPDKKPKPNQG